MGMKRMALKFARGLAFSSFYSLWVLLNQRFSYLDGREQAMIGFLYNLD
jgi:hypothetical protein